MATVKNLRGWIIRDLYRPKVQIVAVGSQEGERKFRAVIYTKSNEYHIAATEREEDDGYLGCIASSRKSRPGEDWTRGNDLPDGSLSKKTWRKILAGIVRYEAQRISSECKDNEKEERACQE